ncbi:hypothetical protein D7Z54_01695 [Salibacterium salarium]|uniref:Uncharacterized protein n=1 Tax=Salibacterium salarium TaxID=284579 RepID=A0A3R9PCA6_9BACI|nr:hypothetical protein [Salibacterium salarium]RSL35304.1 hypothetical protein D7Z54_01695 [Salibacterium salarium]
MPRSSKHNNELFIELKNKPDDEYSKEDATEALNLAKSTGREQEKLLYVSIKHHAKLNEEGDDEENEGGSE